MIRILVYLVALALVAAGADWLLQYPGHIEIVWFGYAIRMNAAAGLVLVVLAAFALAVLWGLLRLIFGLPSLLAVSSRRRRREKGYAALSRGLIATGAGDARVANRAAAQAGKALGNDPLALLLRAQAARLAGQDARAEAAYTELAQREDTRILGLRGLHEEARRRGDDEAARHFAAEAHGAKPLPWSAKTMLEQRAADGDWQSALSTVETSIGAGLIDHATGERQRAVLETAIGLDKEVVEPDAALGFARSAIKRAPDLVPAVALAARLLTRRGDIRKAAKTIEAAWPRCPHPDLARAYLDVRPGDSTSDRLSRAQTLMRIASSDPISRITVARAAMAAKTFAVARDAMAVLIAEGQRPTVRACLLMADLEDAEFGDRGQWREWLARAARAPLDPAWIADGIVYDQWQPVSPTTGRLDAFVWQAPADRLGPTMEAMPASQPLASLALRPEAAASYPEISGPSTSGSTPPPDREPAEDERGTDMDGAPDREPTGDEERSSGHSPAAVDPMPPGSAVLGPALVQSALSAATPRTDEPVPLPPRRPEVIVAPDDPGIDPLPEGGGGPELRRHEGAMGGAGGPRRQPGSAVGTS